LILDGISYMTCILDFFIILGIDYADFIIRLFEDFSL